MRNVDKENIQTKPIASEDREFATIAEFIDDLMRKRGFPLVKHKGSYSWLPGKNRRGSETVAKLCFLGQGAYVFGLREEECEKHGLLRLQYPSIFGVRPKTDATFYGFPVKSDRKSRETLEKYLSKIPEAPADLQIRTNIQRPSMDDFLNQL